MICFIHSDLSDNCILGPGHVLRHVAVHLSCYDAWQELSCGAEATCMIGGDINLAFNRQAQYSSQSEELVDIQVQFVIGRLIG